MRSLILCSTIALASCMPETDAPGQASTPSIDLPAPPGPLIADTGNGALVASQGPNGRALDLCRESGFITPQCKSLRKITACSLYKPHCPRRDLNDLPADGRWLSIYPDRGCRKGPDENGRPESSCDLAETAEKFCLENYDQFVVDLPTGNDGSNEQLQLRDEVRVLLGFPTYGSSPREWNERALCQLERRS